MRYSEKIRAVRKFLTNWGYDVLGEMDHDDEVWIISYETGRDRYMCTLVVNSDEDMDNRRLFLEKSVDFMDSNAQRILERFNLLENREIGFDHCDVVGAANGCCIVKHHVYGISLTW